MLWRLGYIKLDKGWKVDIEFWMLRARRLELNAFGLTPLDET